MVSLSLLFVWLQLEEYRQLAEKSWESLWTYFTMPESDWKYETGKNEQEGIIHSLHTKEYGKIFKLQVRVVNLLPGHLINQSYLET